MNRINSTKIPPLTDRQEALWIDGDLHPLLPINNVLTRLVIHGTVDTDAFLKAFNRLCDQYFVFSSFVEVDKTTGKRVFGCFEKPQALEALDMDGSSISDYEKMDSFQAWCASRFVYEGHLFRAKLVKFSNGLFVFYLNQHHSITDGFSCKKVHELLSNYYQLELAAEGASKLSNQCPDNYPDFLVEKYKQREALFFENDNKFWQSRYQQTVEPVQFYNQPSYYKTAQTTRITYKLDGETVSLINDVSTSISMSVVFTTVLFAFLNRVTLNKDLSIGLPLLNRTGDYSDTLGLFMEVCPNRVTLEDGDTFETIVGKVRKEIEAVRDHRDHFVSAKKAGYEVVLNILASPLDTFAGLNADYELTTPLNLLDELESDVSGAGWSGRESLAIQIQQSSGKQQYEVSFDFNLGVWTTSILRERAIKHFSILLDQFLTDRTQEIATIELLTPEESALLFPKEDSAYFRDEKVPTVVELFKQQVEQTPDKIAVQFGAENTSYASLAKQVEDLAQQLCQQGVRPGVLVGVCIDRSPQMVVCLLAIMQAGGAYVPIDPKQPSDRISIILEDANPLVLITETNLRKKISVDSRTQVICLDSNPESPAKEILKYPDVKGSDLAYVIFTSGSTGRPKGVEVRHHGLTTFLQAMSAQPGMKSQDVILSVTTISFDIAALELFLPLILGATVRIAPYDATINGEALIELLRNNISVLQATPATYRLLISSGWKGDQNLKVLCGGEALSYELAQQLVPKCSSLWNMYGPTETTIWSSVHRVAKDEKSISIGKPIAGTQMFVLNEFLQPVPVGVSGELYIAGDGVAQGYYGNADLTKAQFQPNPFSTVDNAKMYKTGDLVRYTLDMNLEYIGRIDFQVKVRGFRIETGEVETVLGNHDSVAQSVVTTWPDEFGQPALVAYLLASRESGIDGSELRSYLKTKLPDYMIPSKFILLKTLPLTSNGKVDRKALPDPALSLIISDSTEYVEPRNDFERSLVSVWQGVLKSSQIGIEDNFFDLGGDSLMTVLLIQKMERATGIKFDLGDVFSFPTIKQLVEAQNDNVEKRASSIVPLQSKGSGVPLFCLCGINIYQELANSLGSTQPVYGIYVAEEQAFLEDVMAGKKSDISVERLALSYYDAICRQQPEGPYQLAGISFGGLLALETARLLKANNKEVTLVVLLDTILPAGIKRSILNNGKKLMKRILNPFQLFIQKCLHSSESQNPINMSHFREQAFIKCMEGYESSGDLYDGHIMLLKASDHKFWGKGVSFLPDYGWGRFVKGKIECYEVEGDHLGIIEKPNVNKVAWYIKQRLNVNS